MATSYPILVDRYSAQHRSDIAICLGTCKREIVWDVSQGDPDDLCSECNCGGAITMKYMEADPCPNCGELGFFSPILKRHCSRACMLQSEYAETLAKRAL